MIIEAPIADQTSIEDSIIAATKAQEGPLTREQETEAGKQILVDFKSGLATMQDYRDAVADLYLEAANMEFKRVIVMRLGTPYEVWYHKEKDEYGVINENLSISDSTTNENFGVSFRHWDNGQGTAEVRFRDPNYERLTNGPWGPEHTQLAVTKSKALLQKLSTPDPK